MDGPAATGQRGSVNAALPRWCEASPSWRTRKAPLRTVAAARASGAGWPARSPITVVGALGTVTGDGESKGHHRLDERRQCLGQARRRTPSMDGKVVDDEVAGLRLADGVTVGVTRAKDALVTQEDRPGVLHGP